MRYSSQPETPLGGNPTTTLARLAALGSCRFLVYPHYAHAYTYDDFQPAYAAPDVVDGYKDYKPVFDANLAMQRELRKLPLFGSVDVYENDAFLPLVRPGDRIAAVEPVGGTRASFAKFVDEERSRLGAVVKATGMRED